MNKINFKSRIRIVALISFVGSIFLVLSLIGFIVRIKYVSIFLFIIYMCCKFGESIIWRCPK